jgi:DNA polymerase III sliding clamp (beta) subunit (PCNA family)
MQVLKETLEKALRLTARATVDQVFLPILSHICFIQDEGLRSYNDVQSVSVPMEVDFESCAVHLATLLKVISSAPTSAEIALSIQKDELHIRFGKAHVKLPVLKESEFLFTPPDIEESTAIPLKGELLSALDSVLFSVGDDPSRPVSTTVTVDTISRTIWSTDVRSVSRTEYTQKALRKLKEAPDRLLIPPVFIDIMKDIAETEGDLALHLYLIGDTSLYLVSESGYTAFTKLGYDADPPDLEAVFSRLSSEVVASCDAPVGLADALMRCVTVLERAQEDKTATVTIDKRGLRIEATSSFGESRDLLKCSTEGDGTIVIDPSLFVRAMKKSVKSVRISSDALLLDMESGLVHVLAKVGYTKPASSE